MRIRRATAASRMMSLAAPRSATSAAICMVDEALIGTAIRNSEFGIWNYECIPNCLAGQAHGRARQILGIRGQGPAGTIHTQDLSAGEDDRVLVRQLTIQFASDPQEVARRKRHAGAPAERAGRRLEGAVRFAAELVSAEARHLDQLRRFLSPVSPKNVVVAGRVEVSEDVVDWDVDD